jgi:hypothetical protein
MGRLGAMERDYEFREKQKAAVIQALERGLAEYRVDHSKKNTSHIDVNEYLNQAAGYDANKERIEDDAAGLVWWYADAFFDAYLHGFSDMNGLNWPEAEELFADSLTRLKEGRPIAEKELTAGIQGESSSGCLCLLAVAALGCLACGIWKLAQEALKV